MNKRILPACLLTWLLIACDGRGARMSEAAEKCAEAVHVGALEVAEELCGIALGDDDGANLEPELRSERLYRLGNIKRALAKYPEARELMMQSLAIEETRGDSGGTAPTLRRMELSLILAGLGQWEEGAAHLDRVLPYAGQLPEEEQSALLNVLTNYARQLERLELAELASRFEGARADLQARLQSPEESDPP